jgi:hypothetical protein
VGFYIKEEEFKTWKQNIKNMQKQFGEDFIFSLFETAPQNLESLQFIDVEGGFEDINLF